MVKRLILPFLLVALLVGILTTQLKEIKKPDSNSVQVGTQQEIPIGGRFELTSQYGEKIAESQFRGKKILVFFGFTNCPDVCPTTLSVLSSAMEKMDEDDVQILFITVDPERDTPEAMKEYLTYFHSSIIGLTGTEQEIQDVQKLYRAYSQKVDPKKDGEVYSMAHSDIVYVIDEHGNFMTHFNRDNSAEEIAAYINNN